MRRELADETGVAAGEDVTESLLGGPTAWGGIDITFGNTDGGTLSGEFTPIPQGSELSSLIANPGSINFLVPGDPVHFWEIEFEGSFTGTAMLTFRYDDANLTVPEASLFVLHNNGGIWVALPVVSRDPVANTITVTTTSFSPFLLVGPPHASIGWTFSGTAVGGTIEFTVGAVFLSVTTTAGQTSALVATAVADAINADPTLAAAAIIATAEGNTVTTNGPITSSTISDAGITPETLYSHVPEVPALGLAPTLLLGASLLAAAFVALMRRSAVPPNRGPLR